MSSDLHSIPVMASKSPAPPTPPSSTGSPAPLLSTPPPPPEPSNPGFIPHIDGQNWTPAHDAAAKGQQKLLNKLILNEGRQVLEAKTDTGYTVLHAACRGGALQIVQDLIEKHKVSLIEDDAGSTPLHFACQEGHTEVARWLIDNTSLRPAMRNTAGNTPLHFAARKGHFETFGLLAREFGVDPNIANNTGKRPIHSAAQAGHLNMLSVLTGPDYKISIEERNERGWTAAHFAAQGGHATVVAWLVDQGLPVDTPDHSGTTPLLVAVRSNRVDAVTMLITDLKAGVEAGDNFGFRPLHAAAAAGFMGIVVSLVFNHNADVKALTQTGHSPVQLAMLADQEDVVEYLLDHGAQDLVLEWLYYAASHPTPRNNARTRQFLEKCKKASEGSPGSDVLARIDEPHPTLQLTAYQMVSAVRADDAADQGKPPALRVSQASVDDLKAELIRWGSSPFRREQLDRHKVPGTDGIQAMIWNQPGYLHDKLNGASADLIDSVAGDALHRTPLHLACGPVTTEREAVRWVGQLLLAGAHPAIPDDQLWLPLHEAAYSGKKKVVETLLSAPGSIKADGTPGPRPYATLVDFETSEGQTAREIAEERGHMDIAHILGLAGAKDTAIRTLLTHGPRRAIFHFYVQPVYAFLLTWLIATGIITSDLELSQIFLQMGTKLRTLTRCGPLMTAVILTAFAVAGFAPLSGADTIAGTDMGAFMQGLVVVLALALVVLVGSVALATESEPRYTRISSPSASVALWILPNKTKARKKAAFGGGTMTSLGIGHGVSPGFLEAQGAGRRAFGAGVPMSDGGIQQDVQKVGSPVAAALGKPQPGVAQLETDKGFLARVRVPLLNYLAILSLLVEAATGPAFAFLPPIPSWSTDAPVPLSEYLSLVLGRFAVLVPTLTPTRILFAVFAVVLIWAMYVSFLAASVLILQSGHPATRPALRKRFPFIKENFFFEAPGAQYVLPVLTSLAFPAVVSVLLSAVDCSFQASSGEYTLDVDPSVVCWSGAHRIYGLIAMFCIMFYVPTSVFFGLFFLDGSDAQINYIGTFQVFMRLAQFVSIAITTFFTNTPLLVLGVLALLYAWLSYSHINSLPCQHIRWVNIFRTLTMLGATATALVGIFAWSQDSPDSFLPISVLAGAWGFIALLALWAWMSPSSYPFVSAHGQRWRASFSHPAVSTRVVEIPSGGGAIGSTPAEMEARARTLSRSAAGSVIGGSDIEGRRVGAMEVAFADAVAAAADPS